MSEGQAAEAVQVGDGFTVLDGAALIVGAAVAAVHVRDLVSDDAIDGTSWALLWLTLAGVAVTAAGPFVFLLRRYGRRPAGYPRTGDRLWLVLGLPWLLSAPLRPDALAGIVLGVGTVFSSLVALAVVWTKWVSVPAERLPRGPWSWTDRVGLVLSIAWPLQCGFVLVVGAG